MLQIAGLIVAVILAIDVGSDPQAREPAPLRPGDECQPTLSVGHVPGHLNKVWIIHCEYP